MDTLSKGFSLLLVVILAVSNLMIIQSANGQSILKPSVPEFTAQFVDRSYDVPETSTVNQYTGELVITPAHRVQNYTIEITIKNQPYNTAVVQEGTATWNAEFHYDVNVKGHFAQNWTIMYAMAEGPKASNVDYTVITYELVSSPTHPEEGYELRSFFDDTVGSNSIMGIPPNSQLDFRVRAMIGAMHRGYNPDAKDQLSMFPWVFDGETSDWSNTQTIAIAETSTSTSPTPNPTPTPSIPEFSSMTISLLLGLMLATAGLLVYHKKNRLVKKR